MATTFGSSVAFKYSWSSVYSRSFGISDTTHSAEKGEARRGVYPRRKTVSRNDGGRALRQRLTVQRRPHVVHAPLELRQRAIVVDHVVGARPFELGGHLRGDHLHRLGFAQSAILHEALQTQRTVGVDENDAIDAIRHVPFEQQRDVAH